MNQDDPIQSVDAGRRAALKTLLLGAALATPVVASFGMGALSPAQAGASNTGGSNTGGSNVAAIPTLEETAMIGLGGALALGGVLKAYGMKPAG